MSSRVKSSQVKSDMSFFDRFKNKGGDRSVRRRRDRVEPGGRDTRLTARGTFVILKIDRNREGERTAGAGAGSRDTRDTVFRLLFTTRYRSSVSYYAERPLSTFRNSSFDPTPTGHVPNQDAHDTIHQFDDNYGI